MRKNHITPTSIKKEIREAIKATYQVAGKIALTTILKKIRSVEDAVNRLNDEMIKYAQNHKFEKAADVRDEILEGLL